VGKKMTKMGQKLIKIAQNRVVFVHFPYLFSYKITMLEVEGARAPVPHSWRRQWMYTMGDGRPWLQVIIIRIIITRIIISALCTGNFSQLMQVVLQIWRRTDVV